MTFVTDPNRTGLNGVDTRQLLMQTQHDPFSNNTAFDSALNKVGGALSMIGPVGGLLAQRFGGNMGSAVTSSVLSGFSGGSGGFSAPGYNMAAQGPGAFTSSYGGGKMLTMPGAPPGYPGGAGGGAGMGAPPGFPGGGGGMPGMTGLNAGADVGQFDSQINGMMNNNLMFLAVQTKVQNVSQTTQLMSNIYKADSDAKLNAIRNVRS